MKPSFVDVTLATVGDTRRVRGYALPPNGGAVEVLGPLVAAPRPPVDVPALLECLGPLLTADIDFCPQFGLNVHGKRLYVVLDGFTVVTGLNQHERLVAMAALAWLDWQARQTGPSVLSLGVDGSPAALASDGAFDVAVAPSGPVQLVATTDAGDATAVTLP
jgi:hypothetical protein